MDWQTTWISGSCVAAMRRQSLYGVARCKTIIGYICHDIRGFAARQRASENDDFAISCSQQGAKNCACCKITELFRNSEISRNFDWLN